jgi:ribosomal protein S18 acetylase RimI-like enzyme
MAETGDEASVRAQVTTKDGETLTVRRLQSGDAAGLRAFADGLSERTRSLFLPHTYDGDRLAKVMERAEADMDRVYVALSGERVAAYFFLWNFGDPVPVLGIGLADDYQARGLGEQLVQILIDDARAGDRDGIDLTTLVTNRIAFAFYRNMGFQYLGDVNNVAGDGRIVKERRMFLVLKPDAQPPEREHKPPV